MSEAFNVEIRLDIPYGGGPAGDLCVDVYLPTSAVMHPAVLCLHGGAWLRGSVGYEAEARPNYSRSQNECEPGIKPGSHCEDKRRLLLLVGGSLTRRDVDGRVR